MHDRRTVGLAAVVTLLVGVGRVVPDVVSSRLFAPPDGAIEALPQFGSLGETAAVYLGLLQAVGPLVTWTLALGLGYYLARHRDPLDDLRSLATDLATGSVAAVTVVAFGALAVQLVTGSLDGVGILMVIVSLASTVLSSSVPVVVGGVAAAALTARSRESDSGATGEGTTTGTEGDAARERVRERAVEDAD